ncbi:MAG: hypothetical protein R2724_18985 [Bryobacterales bacterium]
MAHPPVFVFIACPDAVLARFERLVEEEGRAGSTIEPIALHSYPSCEYLEAFLDENCDDIACVTIDLQDPIRANALLGIAARVTPNALLLATSETPRAEALLPALRAGASDVLSPPYDLTAAAQLLGGEGRNDGGGGGKIAAFLPAQGGNGASTAAIHFAAALAAELRQEGGQTATSPVLLLDLDFHSDSAAFWLNKRPAYTLLDALEGASASPAYWRKITTSWNGLDLLAPPPPDTHISEGLLAGLRRVIEAAASTYAWVVLDLPPTLFASSRALLPQADLVFLVCTPEARSLFLARRRLADLAALEIGADKLRVTLNRAGAKRAIEAATAERPSARE